MIEKDEKIEVLRQSSLFSRFLEYELDVISRYSEFRELSKGEGIFAAGDRADNLYIVQKGRIGIVAINEGQDIGLAQIIEGETFGEMDYLGQLPRSAAAFTETDSRFLVFPRKGVRSAELIQKYPEIASRILHRIMQTISERVKQANLLMEEKSQWVFNLRKQLQTDKLTGLFNKNYLTYEFSAILPRREGQTSFIMIKPDNFKDINDTWGHTAGDTILNLMAIFLQSALSEEDIGVRYRGDEFAAILFNRGSEESLHVAEEIRKVISAMDISHIVDKKMNITVSIGITTYPEETEDSDTLVERAHGKMMEAREQGGDRIRQ